MRSEQIWQADSCATPRSMNPPETPSSSQPSTLSPGTRFGNYEILQRLGAGGMGEVYRAKDTRLEREVAIKTLSLEHGSQPEALIALRTGSPRRLRAQSSQHRHDL